MKKRGENNKIIKKEAFTLGRVLKKIAPTIGARVITEPEWGLVGQITFKNGKRTYFKYNALDLNSVGASEIARDKDFSNFFMKKMSYPIVPGSKAFFSDEWGNAIGQPERNIDAAYRHARMLGWPVIVKPNSGSQGVGVALVHDKQEFYKAMRAIFKKDKLALVQRQVSGKDYRLVVLDDTIISAYERIPLSVVGDGKSTIMGLLKKKQREFVASSRDTRIKLDDPRIAAKLKRQRLNFESVPAVGQRIYLLDNANLSTGGDSVDVTGRVHADFRKLAIALTRDMGLRLCGVDVMVAGDIAKPLRRGQFWILEINAAPGLDHYAKIGKAQEKIVEDLYLKVLKRLEK